VLLIQTPDGKFVCNDNTNAALLDPTVTLTKPAQGRYNVWLGSARARDLIPGFLVFTGKGDVSSGGLALPNLVKRPAQPEVLPLNNRLASAATRVAEAVASVKTAEKLAPGGGPLTAQVTATGNLPAPEVATGDSLCGGLITVAPNYAFEWSGQAKALGVMFEGDSDATVIVRTPDGTFVCADDADGNANLNPLVILAGPASGRYLIWVGRVDPAKPVTGKLTVASSADLKPVILKKR
jgi:serine protease Do